MYKLKKAALFLLMVFAMTVSVNCITAKASSNYQIVIEDDANLLTEQEENELVDIMTRVSVYGNVGIKTIKVNEYGNAKYYSNLYFDELFGATADGTLLLIDMDTREIVLTSEGRIKHDVDNVMADTIMDNVYRYATMGQYKKCCLKTFEQVYNLVEGRKIAQPMKHICNLLLAAILAILINYAIVKGYTRKIRSKIANDYSKLDNAQGELEMGKLIRLNKIPKEIIDLTKGSPSYASKSSSYGSYGSYHSSSSSSYSSSHRSSHSSSHSSSSSRSSSHSRHSSGSHRF